MEIPEIDELPEPNSSRFGIAAYNLTKWMKAAATAFNGLRRELLDALNAALLGTKSTSVSSITIASSGTINITVEANKGYAIGMTVKIASTANPANYVKGTVTAYTSATGAMSVLLFSKGGSGTFANWSVFFDVPDASVLSVPTGESVAAGNLLAIDDAGNSMSAGSITTSVLQAVTATSFHACPLANGNTAIFWTAGTGDVKMMIISKTGSTVLAATTVLVASTNSPLWSAELTDGNIVLVFISTSNEAAFRTVNTSGIPQVTAQIEAGVTASGQIKCCALTGGGFAVNYNVAANNRYAVYTNAGVVTKAPTTNVSGGQSMVAICPTAAGGFVALAGISSLTGSIYNSAGTLVSTCALNIPVQINAGIASKAGSVFGAGRRSGTPFYGPTLHLASDTANSTINSPDTAGNAYIRVDFEDPIAESTLLGASDVAALGNGLYIATYSATSSSSEYPRYVIFSGDGQLVKTGILFTETTYTGIAPVYVIPKDTNGFSLIWLASNRNIKFAQVKSGNIVGISLGAVGSTHQYLASGSANVTSGNMLNVGSSKINYVRYSAKVVI